MKGKFLINGKEIEIEVKISEEDYKKIIEEKKTGYERVTRDDEFYYVAARGAVELGDDRYTSLDNNYYDRANYYSSAFIAENNARVDQLMRQIRRFSIEHRDSKIDWNDKNIDKYFIYYNFKEKTISKGINTFVKDFGIPYFDSLTAAQSAIDEFRDELIWYFTEYKDSL